MSHREYSFPLPYKIPFQYVSIVIEQAKNAELFYLLPRSLQDKLETGAAKWHHVDITKEDLDVLPDEVWLRVEEKLKELM